MPAQYLPIGLLFVLALGFGLTVLIASTVIGPRRPNPAKLVAYESGIRPITSARQRFPVHFYLIAMLFIVFDIEVVFFYPWAATFRLLHWFGLVEMLIFVAVLLAGYVYVWRKGAFRWQ
jgi:NADH-quinone oxidoreductase subunit A